jgi:hypothetical protein
VILANITDYDEGGIDASLVLYNHEHAIISKTSVVVYAELGKFDVQKLCAAINSGEMSLHPDPASDALITKIQDEAFDSGWLSTQLVNYCAEYFYR